MYESPLQKRLPITVDKDIMSGTPVFEGTRVPIQTLFDYLMDGCELAEFLDNFPTVSQEAALAILAYAGSQIAREAAAA
ncbi:MAG TPA: DUF433 domain-containing protein [Roseiflexaceae bacterium]|jgi:uncharacterized protein (DUF433 family)|nr:DUF433 domain-containing protein [Roseiflexaceae bacterium]